jgi:hypothetical protein
MFRKLLVRIALTLTLALAAGCGEDSGPGPGIGAVNFGTLAAGTDKLVGIYVTGNAPILGSLAYFVPYIRDVLTPASPGILNGMSTAPAQTCLTLSIVGKVFDFDGSAYVATGETGPADGVRFLLRPVGNPGPNPPIDPIGYVDIVCASTLPAVDLTVTVVSNSVTVLEAAMTGLYSTYPTLTLGGFYASNTGAAKLPIRSGQVNGGISLQTTAEFLVLPDMVAGYRVIEGPVGNVQVLFTAHEGVASPVWDLDVYLAGTAAGPVSQGTAVFKDELVACISGTLSNPIASDPEDVGCSLPDTPVGSVSRADREAMMDACVNLRILYGYLRFLADLGLAAVTVPG